MSPHDHSTMNMDTDTDMSSSSSSSSSSSMTMNMVFFSSTTTPLFSDSLTPSTAGGYAGLCIFLIILATITRLLWAFKTVLERRWLDKERQRRYVVVRDEPTEAQRVQDDSDAKEGTLISARGPEEKVRILTTSIRPVTAWRLSVDLPRAALGTLIAGLGYLLMLAVMTMNVGYFLSVLAGLFVGDVAVGRYGVHGEH